MGKLILASASPRRREILTLAGVPFEVVVAQEETAPAGLTPADYTLALARCKAQAVFKNHPDSIVLGADTIVVRGDTVLGKPRDEQDAVEMLLSLGGRTHQVMTGVWVCSPERCDGFTDIASVHFYPLTREEAEAYVATKEPMDKAGSYAIQGYGMRFVRGIEGDFYTVMGLPGGKTRRFLETFSVEMTP
ncbi:MAG: septum formation protein Maf [Clostridia bacterium]|nr:septum formation protein Maf [Clostridia bacterium]